jgi:hypothetical protein
MFTIAIKTDNAAFDPDPNREISRILMNLTVTLLEQEPGDFWEYDLRDVNGNGVGTARLVMG